MIGFKKFCEGKESVVVFYHDDNDGFGAAYALWKKFGESAKYVKSNHGDKLSINKGDVVYFLDFSVKPAEMNKLAKKASKIIILDHHKGALDEFNKAKMADNIEINYDIKKSGATVVWDYFYKTKPPKFIKHIEDYDLYKFKIPKTKEFSLWMINDLKDFRELDKIKSKKDFIAIYKKGSEYHEEENKKVKKLLKTLFIVNFEGYRTGVIKSKEMTSVVGRKIIELGFDLAIVYGEDKNNSNVYTYGLRSDVVDVSKLAQKYGGNGHVKAAGFSKPKNKKIWKEV